MASNDPQLGYPPERKFSRKLMLALMENYIPSWREDEEWSDSDVSLSESDESSDIVEKPAKKSDTLTLVIKRIIDWVLRAVDKRKMQLYFLFIEEFRQKQIDEPTFEEVVTRMSNDVLNSEFDEAQLLWYCTLVAHYSAIAYEKELLEAPDIALDSLDQTIDRLKETGKFPENWLELLSRAAIEMGLLD